MASKLPTVAIIGQANVGKSSLFNRLVRANQAIVAREAGTTRDSVIGKVSVNSHGDHGDAEFWLIDTAGLKMAEDEFEATIQEQIIEATDVADVIMVVVDSTKYISDDDRLIAKKALRSKKPVILVVNKTDLRDALPNDEFQRLGIKTIIRSSAEHTRGIHEIIDAIASEIPSIQEQEPDDVLRIALIGRPNVGKSSLFNTLAGKQQAIVANVAGTTRDLNRIPIRFKKRNIELIDTAGMRKPGKQEVGIEKFSVLRTMQAIEQADICFLLMDANELNTQLDQRLAGIIDEAGKGMVIVVSKWDIAGRRPGRGSDEPAKDQDFNQESDADRKSSVVDTTVDANRKPLTKSEKLKLARSLRHGEDVFLDKDEFTRDSIAPRISRTFDFTPWAPLIFTSSVTGQNVTKLFDLALDIDARRSQETKTRVLNDLLQEAVAKHPPAGLKNTHPKLRYMVQTDTAPPWFVIYGSNLKFIHWSYKRYLERLLRETYDYTGTPVKFSFRDEKQIKANREKANA